MQLEKHLYELELVLQRQDIRANAEKFAELLEDDFYEVGASGKVWTKRETVLALQNESIAVRTISEFKIKLLAPDVALATYRCHRGANQNQAATHSLRSSIWRYRDDRWRMVFHQGTALPSDE